MHRLISDDILNYLEFCLDTKTEIRHSPLVDSELTY